MATSVANMEASDPPATAEMDYETPQSLNVVDESGRDFGTAFPLPKSSFRRVCPTSRLILALMVFCGTLILSVSILGIQGIQFSKNLQEARRGLQNFNKTVKLGVGSLKDKRNSTWWKLATLEKTLEQENDQLEKVKERTQSQLDIIERNTRTLHCELIEMQSNGSKSGCCPRGWLTFRSSCYWTTQSQETWEGAKRDCENKKSHLVIINSPNEKVFVNRNRRTRFTWIGLTDVTGNWKWVDGSLYVLDPKDWSEGQPDHWYGHGLGGGEDCVHIGDDGLWNDNHCSRMFGWVCEMELGI
ncbi:asialoglycoprotein receptor 1-like [Python bivittatus]|uniref:Asialoglycoprotein receptor 1-like n=1 Tax=Python bivittatus TaxID=176946 RepID=A0A9F2WIR3_PYTBI|nr:asialoglycoprotein receptor 1-like [Python bivittatus]